MAYRRALRELARREGWSFRFYDQRALARLGAGAFLAVSRASAHRGAGIVHLGYRAPGRGRRPRIGLVGKGICCDTGASGGTPPLGVPEGDRFPHIYGPINLDAVVKVFDFIRDSNGDWALPSV